MLAIAVTLAALVASAVAVLAIPVVLAVDAELADRITARWRVQWLFGLVVTGSRDPGTATPPGADHPKPAPPAPPQAPRAGRARRIGIAVLRTRGLLPRVMQLATELLRQVTIDRLQLRATFGLDDPADTGRVYGTMSPVLVAAGLRGLDVQCRPLFDRAGVNGTLHATIRVRPLSLGTRVVMFAVSPPVRRAAVRAWRVRR